MKASRMFIKTLKEAPQEAQIPSHILLLRSGMIKKVVSGVYSYMPLGLKVLKNIENVIRDEMNKTGAEEILCSALQPKELWVESGRWDKYGPELMRLSDRNKREFCLGPTHEEVFTDLVKSASLSYKNLPFTLYQIQTKYRDEIRPRFGLIRGREFIMKDAYSFDIDDAGLEEEYEVMYKAYENIFKRLHLNYKVVLADTGTIGGSLSHQFMALSEIGESEIIYNDNYAADQEKAESLPEKNESNEPLKEIQEVNTPAIKTIEELSTFLSVDKKKIIKSIVYKDYRNNRLVLCLVRGDRDINKIKAANVLDINEDDLDFAKEDDFEGIKSVFGFIGPVSLDLLTLVDTEVKEMVNAVSGSNKKDCHLVNVNYGRDFTGEVKDLRLVQAGDLDPIKGEPLKSERGTEVGQIFKLGTKYSKSMNATYINEKGESIPIVMGCYGIGVSRTLQAIIEQYHDEHGITFPVDIAPYKAVIIPVKYQDEMKDVSDSLYKELTEKGIEVILDDRPLSFGVKAHDWDLIGIPYHLIVGRDSVNKMIEFKDRLCYNSDVIGTCEAVTRLTDIRI